MQIVQGADMPFVMRNNPRGGSFEMKSLLEGTPGTKGNFLLTLSRTFADFASPRHRHNFDQVRVQISGESAFGRDGTMRPGVVGYFPEGTFYGPQSAEGEAIVLVLQLGGASGNGYMAEAQLQAGMAALKTVGTFEGGVFSRLTGEGRKRQDAYEACWEHWSGRRMDYPAPRYAAPVLMLPEGFAWVNQVDGVATKRLGGFNEAGTELLMLRVEAGATGALTGAALVYGLAGTGRLGADPVKPGTALHLAAGEKIEVAAGSELELLVIRLPVFA